MADLIQQRGQRDGSGNGKPKLESGRGASSGMDLTPSRILLVDDEEANLAVLRRVLLSGGYSRIVDTTDSMQVVSLYHSFLPDLICLDLNMPALDGFGVLERIAPEIPKDSYLPILILTSDSSASSKRRALALGATDFVTKPFDPDEVLLRIQNLLVPRFMHLELAGYNQTLERLVRQRTKALEESRLEVLERLALAAEFRDDATGLHAARVGRIGEQLLDAHPERLDELQAAELLERSGGRRGDERDVDRGFGHRDDLVVRQRLAQQGQPQLGALRLRGEKNLHARW